MNEKRVDDVRPGDRVVLDMGDFGQVYGTVIQMTWNESYVYLEAMPDKVEFGLSWGQTVNCEE